MKKEIIINKSEGKRIDQYLAEEIPGFSRSYFLNLIKTGNVKIDGKAVKPSNIVKKGNIIMIDFLNKPESKKLLPENIKLDIIFENEDAIVINKQAGLVVHPANGNWTGTLINALLNHFPKIKEVVYDKTNEVSLLRPGLVHRLDKDTSGIMIIAKNKRAMRSLSKQIQNRTINKIYWAICFDCPKNESGELISYLGRHPKDRKLIADIGKEKGKEAISKYKVINCYETKVGKFSLIEFNIKTGRTHQIRVQAANMGNPVLGDEFYGNKLSKKLSIDLKIKRQLLHAKKLEITLPGEHKPTPFEARLPKDMNFLIENK